MEFASAVTRVLRDLEDSEEGIWTRTEIEGYVEQGYDELLKKTQCLWDMVYAENLPYAGNHSDEFEESHMEFLSGVLSFTGGEWERDYLDNGTGPANHTSPWEAANISTDLFLATFPLQETLVQVDRVTFNNYRIDAAPDVDLRRVDARYQYTAGPTRGYSLDEDGVLSIRKFPVPAERATKYTVSVNTVAVGIGDHSMDYEETAGYSTYGFLAFVAEWERRYMIDSPGLADHTGTWETAYFVPQLFPSNGTRGMLRRASASELGSGTILGSRGKLASTSHFPGGSGRGVARRLYSDTKNVRVEIFRRAPTLGFREFEIPDIYVRYVERYARSLARGPQREGPGQDLKMAEHDMGIFSMGVERIKDRMRASRSMRTGRLGTLGGRHVQVGVTLPFPYPSVRW